MELYSAFGVVITACYMGARTRRVRARRPGESRSIEMLDDFNHCCCIKTAEPLVPVHQRPLDQVETGLLSFRELIELEVSSFAISSERQRQTSIPRMDSNCWSAVAGTGAVCPSPQPRSRIRFALRPRNTDKTSPP